MENQKRYRLTPRQSEIRCKGFGSIRKPISLPIPHLHYFDVITDVEKVDIKDRVPLEVEGADRDDLMVNWMRELLYLYQGSGYLLKEFRIREAKDKLVKAEVCGEKIDPDRHEINKEIRGDRLPQKPNVKDG